MLAGVAAFLFAVPAPAAWYVNPATGNDSNDGTTAATAWQTAARLQQALDAGTIASVQWPWQYQNGTAVPTNIDPKLLMNQISTGAIVFKGTDIFIDTSGGPWVIDRGISINSKSGIRIASATSGVAADIRVLRPVAAGWTPVAGTSHTFANTDTENYAVLWENRDWYNHPVGTTYSDVASSLDSTPGSFWTDGTTMYVHPFGDTDPRTDGKIYERSRRLAGSSADVGHVIELLQASNCVAEDLLITGTTLVQPNVNDVAESGNHYPIYCEARNQFIHRCSAYYSEKHGIGMIEGGNGMFGLLEDCVSEQGTIYTGPGGQTPYVAYGMTNGIVHLLRCQCTRYCGLIGSTAGNPAPLSGGAFYCHGITGGEIVIQNGNFTGTSISGENLILIQGTHCNVFNPYAPGTADACQFDGVGPVPFSGATITVTNSLFSAQTIITNFTPQGSVVCDGCTFDARGLVSAPLNFAYAAFFNAQGSLNLTVRNSIFVAPPGTDFNLFFTTASPGSDTVALSSNVYLCGTQGRLLGYWNGYTTTTYQTPAQAQAAGLDSGSLATDPLLASDGSLLPASPAIDYTANRGPLDDVTGVTFATRNDAGAFEYPLPAFRQTPVGGTFTEGGSLILSATVAGNGPFTDQWQRNGQNVAGATGATLTLNPTVAGQSGSYVLLVGNSGGTVTSPAATVVIDPVSFAQWRTSQFTPAELNNAAISGPSADPDGDGLVNLLEYALGGNAKQASDGAGIRPQFFTNTDANGRHLALTYRRLINYSQLTYLVEVSSDLSNWDDSQNQVQAVGSPQPTSDGRTETVTMQLKTPIGAVGGQPANFLRLRVNSAQQ